MMLTQKLLTTAGTDHGMERQLGGASDDALRLLCVADAGQLDDDAPLSRAGECRLGDAERVDSASQHLERAVGDVAGDRDRLGVLRLQDDLRATAQVQPEPGRFDDREDTRGDKDDQRQQRSDQRGAGQDRLPTQRA